MFHFGSVNIEVDVVYFLYMYLFHCCRNHYHNFPVVAPRLFLRMSMDNCMYNGSHLQGAWLQRAIFLQNLCIFSLVEVVLLKLDSSRVGQTIKSRIVVVILEKWQQVQNALY